MNMRINSLIFHLIPRRNRIIQGIYSSNISAVPFILDGVFIQLSGFALGELHLTPVLRT
jgi:hypothetical protein